MKSEILQPKVEEEATLSPASEALPAEEGPEQEVQPKRKVEKKAGKRVGYNYIIVKSYKESQKNDVVKCLYIKSLTNWGFCVIKEGSYGDTKDKYDRDIIDRLKWQKELHEQLQYKIRIPHLLGHFEEGGNYYLVIGHIKGKPLYKVCDQHERELKQGLTTGNKIGRRFLDYLIQIATLLETIHKQGIVHRDATSSNYMITAGGKVALIDMELSYSIPMQFPTPAFSLGTHGYMSKQQEAVSVPTTAEDIFAFGAIMLEMWSDIPSSKTTNEPIDELIKKISFFIPDQQIANMVTQCLLPEDDKRPNATYVLQVLKQYEADLKNKVSRPVNQRIYYSRDEILTTVQAAIDTLATPLFADIEKGWFSDDLEPPPPEDKHKLRKRWYTSYNRGGMGIVYVLMNAKSAGVNTDLNIPFIEKALDLVKGKYVDRIEHAPPGLHFGADGIAATLSAAIRYELIDASAEHLEWIDLLLEKSSTTVDIAHGVSGQGMANLISRSFISPQRLQERLQRYAELLISQQHKDGYWIKGYYQQKYTKRKMKRITRGFTEGMAGIVCFLLEYGYRYQHEPSKNAAQRGLQWLIKKAKRKNGDIEWTSARGTKLGYGWADGAAGIAFTFIRAFRLTNVPAYRKYAEQALHRIPVDTSGYDISQDNGISSIGEVYLEAWRTFNNPEWFDRATWIAQVIMQQKKQHPKYGLYWVVKGEREPVANLMAGNSGVIHFLLRYCYPDKIGFPLMPED
ncbi:MAG: protein kinase [Niastella sp.]|nr:protein kinase [Niastella sp.]